MQNDNHHKPADAQWLLRPEGTIPPVGFAIPLDKLDELVADLAHQPTVERATVFARVKTQMLARYAVEAQQFQAAATNARTAMELSQRQLDQLVQQPAAADMNVLETTARLPDGWLAKAWVGFLALITLLLGVSEWLNNSGFVARGETHDLLMAMAYTLVIPLAAMALKLPISSKARWLTRCLGVFAYVLGVLAGFCFIWQLAHLYASPEPSVQDLLQQVNNSRLQSSGTLDKRWLLLCQNLTGIATGLACVVAISRRLVVGQRWTLNPSWTAISEQIETQQRQLADLRNQWAEAAGRCDLLQASIEAETDRALGRLEKLRNVKRTSDALLARLQAEEQEARHALGWATNGNHSSLNLRTK